MHYNNILGLDCSEVGVMIQYLLTLLLTDLRKGTEANQCRKR